ncbi:MAG: hypothetical protein GXY22_07180 [Clostridiaceae bacterium]|jgi:hypothetical protein|nr:hypothetical protein [Eubacteriales bacterium]NLV48421.1 hypothetical protein [Clostridiaceae bacterium]
MISCTEFIPAYSAYFSFLDQLAGKKAVVTFWEYLSDNYLDNLRDLATQKGLRGCYEYWSLALNEEAATFVMTLDEENGFFEIDMQACPSKGRLLELTQMEPYPDYCEHCDVLYRRVLEPLGFTYDIDLSRTDKAQCTITVRKNPENK